MIGVFHFPAMTWTLTAVLLAGGACHVVQAARSRQPTDRVNNTLHALMNALMAGMLWNLSPATLLAQITVLAAAAAWFALQAIARPEFTTLCAAGQGRLRCAYHALTMAAAALMTAMMAGLTTPTTTPAGTAMPTPMPMSMPMPMAHGHHTTAAPAGSSFDPTPALAILPAVLFGTAALIFTARLLRHRATTARTTAATAAPARHPHRAGHGLEALGAATMALMFAAMTP